MTDTTISSTSIKSRRQLNIPTIQNFHLVWLDESIDEDNNRDSIIKLQQVVNTINIFTDTDECIDFITDIEWEMGIMMVSKSLFEIIGPVIQEIHQISLVYIYCNNKLPHENWIQQWPKVKGVYADIISICKALKIAAQYCDQNSVSISFIKSIDETSNQVLDQLDSSFMHTQLLTEIILTIDFEQQHINDFLIYCREKFISNTGELKNADKIEREYYHQQPIWWYTYPCFLYSMLNRALRLMEVDLIIKMGFFVRDLHNHIAALHLKQYNEDSHQDSFIVYRGQGLTN